ncbi:amyloid fiber anchoring/assembly protein TapA [Metabacillus sp. 84]|uniref:amyloid fiber anchoring/assembly protein TapA n=1 Tax=Metabacillus sp. 84 TaxID=3404705 RepID=UPI003CFA2637
MNHLLKCSFIAYFLILFLTYITSPTSAYFTDGNEQSIQIKMGSWWDKSELSFMDIPVNDALTVCGEPAEIKALIQNMGFTMLDGTSYRIYMNEKMIEDGNLPAVKTGETAPLSIKAGEAGTYRFEVDQRPGYGGNDKETASISSHPVEVKGCSVTAEEGTEPFDDESGLKQTHEPASADLSAGREPAARSESEVITDHEGEIADESSETNR